MRFRATLEDVGLFLRIFQSVEKLSRKCILWLREDRFDIICRGDIQVWSHINADIVFSDYRIQSNSSNTIAMEISLDALVQALKSASGDSAEVVVKLAKKNDHAVLSFEIKSQSRQAGRIDISQDVRVKVLKPADMASIKEPQTPAGDVSIYLPPLPKVRPIVDRLARIGSPKLGISATLEGDFRLSLQVEEVRVDTHWNGLRMAVIADEDEADKTMNKTDGEPVYHSVLVSTRSFAHFLAAQAVATASIAYIVENHCLIMYVYIGDAESAGGVLTYYIPALVEDAD